MRLIEKYDDIFSFLLKNKELYLFYDNNNLSLPKKGIDFTFSNPKYLYETGNKILVQNDYDFYEIEKGGQTSKLPFQGKYINIVSKNKILEYYRGVNGENRVKLHVDNKIVWDNRYEYLEKLATQDSIFLSSSYESKDIFKKDLITFNTLWQLDVSEMGKYTDHEGEHSGKVKTDIKYFEPSNSLIFGITDQISKNWVGIKFVSIDAKTGNIKWIYKPEDERTLREDFYFYNNLMYLLSGSNLLIIDPYTGKVKEDHDLSDQFSGESIESYNNYTIQNNKLYFSDTKHKKIGVINLNNFQVEEVVNVETENADWIERPIVNDSHLYVKDSNKTLHVFELD